MEYMPYIWILAAVIFAFIEAATLGLATIWFAIGALLALLCTVLGGSLGLQIAVFIVVSVIMLVFTRPVAVKYLKIGRIKTNAESLVGTKGVVIKTIPALGTGQVKVSGQIWTAKEADSKSIEEGIEVEVVTIEGVKLIVKAAEDNDIKTKDNENIINE